MKYVDGINFVTLVLLAISIAIDIGLVNILTRSLDARDRLAKARDALQEEKAHLAALSEALHKTEFEHSQLLEQQRLQDQAAIADLFDALTDCQEQCKALERQTVEVEAVKPATKRNSKGQFAKKVTSDESSQ